MTPELGLIDGRFGRPWTAQERRHVARTLAEGGFGFYHHAPKADRALRREWQRAHSPEETAELAEFSAYCRDLGLRFGIGLTPIGATHPFDGAARDDLARRIAELDAIGLDDLCIFFDDLRGDLPDLARRQADVVNFAAERTKAGRIFTCPTYYSDDPVLDVVFGARPKDYLSNLGRHLAPGIEVYWTGEEVCSRAIEPAHLARVTRELGRKVTLWDNYPVNDGARMSRFLHLRAFTGRPAANAAHIAGHAVNPAIQAHLSCLPALTLPMVYAEAEDYAYGAAFAEVARTHLGPEFAKRLMEDLAALQDIGHERLGPRADRLRGRYASLDHPAAREIMRWLDCEDLMRDDEVQTQ
ncbi:beta-N-acetylglucosaminidase domain-containing protein [Novosphingobium decolorationis]|uniref:Beta-N-acetylglucosaminidase domain-containing protein n=1 Tax=Novosphingobium decolorationis TaxID=2698673 RepID=A0ABX8E302_9SPHN|nr:beta-N-acetylglucosaminidase domain-containing protein [Novosphingobium decolorationis]QVM82595.1 beta-N-acetylglucosaminidase domain-containing protein [Novosphingobium decolorationis]